MSDLTDLLRRRKLHSYLLTQGSVDGGLSVPGPPTFMGSPFWVNLKSSNTSKLKAGIARVLANTGNGYISFWGDSTTEGQASLGTSASNRAAAFPELLAAQLNTLDSTYQALANSFMGVGGETTLANYTTYNPQMVFGADWVLSSGSDVLSFGGRFVQEPAAGTTYITYTPTAAFDRAEILYRASSANTMIIEDDIGGVVATFNTGVTTTVQRTVVTMGKSCTFLKVKTGGTGTCSLIGISTYTTAQKKLLLWNMGWRASLTTQWGLTSQGFNPINAVDEVVMDAVFIDICINDPNNGTDLGLYRAALLAMGTAIKAAGSDVIYSCGVPSDPTTRPSYAQQDQYRSVVYSVAAQLDAPLIDERSRFVSFAVANAAGQMFDDIHPNNVGYPIRANVRRDFIAAVRALP